MNKHEAELVRRLRDINDNGYIGDAGLSVRCCAASYIEHLAPAVEKCLEVVAQAVAAEREACAKIADEHSSWARSYGAEKACEMVAAAIRNRPTK